MAYSVSNINGCTKKITFTFEQLDLSTQIQKAVKEKQKQANLKGFRKGKAPLPMVEKLFGPQIESEAVNKFVQEQLFEAIDKEDFRVVGYPKFENMKYEQGKSIAFDAQVEIFPIVELKDVSGYKFKKDKVEVTNEELAKYNQSKIESKASMNPVADKETKAANGHFVVINFEGEKENGERPANMKGEEHLLELGSNQFIPGFEEGIVGMKTGDKKVLELTFPESYHVDDLKNAKVKFHTELLEIKEKKYPELNDELAKELGFESLEDLNTKAKTGLLAQKDRMAKEKLHQEILEKLVAENKFDIPMALLAQQKESLKKDIEGNLRNQGFNDLMVEEYFEKWAGDLTSKAEFQVRSGLILDKLGKDYHIETTEADFERKLEEMATQSGLSVDEIKKYYGSNQNIKKNMMYGIREEMTFEKLVANMTVE